MMHYLNVYLKIMVVRQHTVLFANKNFGACPPPNIIALEQNDNQAAHKLYLRNIENLPYWLGILFGK